jgi:hypothetical protein
MTASMPRWTKCAPSFVTPTGELARLHAIGAAATLMRKRDFDAPLH